MGYPNQNPEDAAMQQRDQEVTQRDYPERQEGPVEKVKEVFSHYLHLADGTTVKHDVDNSEGVVPTDVNGVPVVSVSPATVGGPT